MPGKPFQSKLAPHEAEIRKLRSEGLSYRKIAAKFAERHALNVSHNAVYSFVNAVSRRVREAQTFCDGLDPDIRDGLLKQMRTLWTHGSNAIEGNTLTLGETSQVLELGLTISGKSLKDHEEAVGHARAVDMIRDLLGASQLTDDDLFALHGAIMPKGVIDAMNPVGDWKRDYNGTTGVVGGKTRYVEYSSPRDTPFLMTAWLKQFNRLLDACRTKDSAVKAYAWSHMAFVRVHPFFDGNGRMARLLSNLPVLRGGFPPILISPEQRGVYIDLLWRYQSSVGVLRRNEELLPDHPSVAGFKAFLVAEWSGTMKLLEEARAMQARRCSGGRGYSAEKKEENAS